MGRMFENRKGTMFKRWDRMAKAFTRAGREISLAVRASGPSLEANPSLRRAVQNARAVNMPKDKIENAIKKASGEGGEDFEILIYEGYGPHGVPVLVETATDNPTRTVANVRMHFRKGNGNMGTTGSVSYMFEKTALFRLNPEGLDRDELELDLIDHGLQDLEDGETDKGEPLLVLSCDFTDFGTLQSALDARDIEPISSATEYVPTTLLELSEEEVIEVLELVDRLEQDDDVQNVYHNLA
jgi:YebC/PmpR family DNA-binding regulatory protein